MKLLKAARSEQRNRVQAELLTAVLERGIHRHPSWPRPSSSRTGHWVALK